LFQGYQFWTQADEKGYFIIKNVLPGEYNLYAWVPGFIGDYKNGTMITIKPG
jgi:rhamnogalacturonan endolyase